jgi:putative addiction module killer protein
MIPKLAIVRTDLPLARPGDSQALTTKLSNVAIRKHPFGSVASTLSSFYATMGPVDELVALRIYGSRFSRWLGALKDKRTVAIIRARLNRVRLGNFGDSKPVGGGVEELRIDFGPGYRVYFGRDGESVVILLCGGTKRTQSKDIATARALWKDYLDGKD